MTQATRATRLARVVRAEDVPDLAGEIMAATAAVRGRRRPRLVLIRASLLVVALVQLGLAAHTLLGAENPAAHITHEVSAFNAALAVGFLWAVAWPHRAVGQLPVVTALVILLIMVTLPDLLAGHTHGARELMHGLLVLALVLLTALAGYYATPPTFGGSAGAEPPAGTAAEVKHMIGRRTTQRLDPGEATGRASAA